MGCKIKKLKLLVLQLIDKYLVSLEKLNIPSHLYNSLWASFLLVSLLQHPKLGEV